MEGMTVGVVWSQAKKLATNARRLARKRSIPVWKTTFKMSSDTNDNETLDQLKAKALNEMIMTKEERDRISFLVDSSVN